MKGEKRTQKNEKNSAALKVGNLYDDINIIFTPNSSACFVGTEKKWKETYFEDTITEK